MRFRGRGGTYWSDDETDARDFKWESDPNDERKRSLVLDFLERLQQKGLLPPDCTDRVDQIIEEAPIKDARLMDIIEFGRVVHAEMSALMDAARLGRAVQDGILYCTTFPCHICAKHITAAGVAVVYFLGTISQERRILLTSGLIEIQGSSRVHFKEFQKTEFIHFHGISPRRYRDFFERSKRKDELGKAQEWVFGVPKPILEFKLPIYTALEVTYKKHSQSELI